MGTVGVSKYRKHPAVLFVVMLVGLIITGGLYSIGATAANKVAKDSV